MGGGVFGLGNPGVREGRQVGIPGNPGGTGGLKRLTICQGGGGGVDFFWNNLFTEARFPPPSIIHHLIIITYLTPN